jgi:hypothetical protein
MFFPPSGQSFLNLVLRLKRKQNIEPFRLVRRIVSTAVTDRMVCPAGIAFIAARTADPSPVRTEKRRAVKKEKPPAQ